VSGEGTRHHSLNCKKSKIYILIAGLGKESKLKKNDITDSIEIVNNFRIAFSFCHSREGGNPEFSSI